TLTVVEVGVAGARAAPLSEGWVRCPKSTTTNRFALRWAVSSARSVTKPVSSLPRFTPTARHVMPDPGRPDERPGVAGRAARAPARHSYHLHYRLSGRADPPTGRSGRYRGRLQQAGGRSHRRRLP